MATFNQGIVKRDQTAWNIAQVHSSYVGNLVVQAWREYEQGDIDKWFWKLNVIREVTGHDLTTTEITDLNNLEEEIFSIRRNIKVQKKGALKDKVMEYGRRIMKILKAQGYLPSKEDRTKLTF
jgi:hypothetical protein